MKDQQPEMGIMDSEWHCKRGLFFIPFILKDHLNKFLEKSLHDNISLYFRIVVDVLMNYETVCK